MIISHEHRFVFIKTRKTAGSTIEALLRSHAGEGAVITPLLPAPVDLVNRDGQSWRGLFNPLPDMYRRWNATGRGYKVLHRGIFQPLVELRARKRFYEHMSLALVRERAGRSIDGYFTFCFERNPWDKSLSAWLWANRHRRDQLTLVDFEAWVLNPATKGLFSEWYMYTANDEVAVDFVGRFERLEDDLRFALDHVGIDTRSIVLPHEKETERPRSTPISEAARERIAAIFHREVAEFGYDVPVGFDA
jgi:hypothetical protein